MRTSWGSLRWWCWPILSPLIFYLEMKLGSNSPPDIEGRGFRAKAMGALSVLHAIGTAPSFYPALLFSLLMPFCQILGLWAMMQSYGLALYPFWRRWWCCL